MSGTGDPSRKHILIIDDDPSVLSLLETYVSLEGFKVTTAEDGTQALRKLGDKAPDLIVTDLMMPNQGGFDLLRQLKADGRGAIPVFVVTAKAMDDSTKELIQSEGNVIAFVPKPVSRAQFVGMLHHFLKTNPPQSGDRGLNELR